jgi:hypothetical protein
MTRKEAIEIFFNRIKQARADDQRAKGIRASGFSADTQRVEVTETGGTLYGADYFYFQKEGRKPGGMPPVEAIIQWLKDKTSLSFSEERGPGLTGLAWAIAKKIAMKGTDIYQRKRPGLSIEDKIAEFKKELTQNIAQAEKEKIIEAVKNAKDKTK